MRSRILLLLFLTIILIAPGSALAQNLAFSVPELTVDAYWNEDGTLSVDYIFLFDNHPSGDLIDYVDVGLPNAFYDIRSIYAEINGQPLDDIEPSDYLPAGVSGVAIGLGQHAIRPGETGELRVYVGRVERVLYTDSTDPEYASTRFATTYFDRQFVRGDTDMLVVFHLPPDVQPEEPRWHPAPAGFPSEPETGVDSDGRIFYAWHNPNANAYTAHEFGASFPRQYVPDSAIGTVDTFPPSRPSLRISVEALFTIFCLGAFFLFLLLGIVSGRRRKLQYLPPKISIEGHGIKRGLTAVEAAILMEQQMDKIMTMILFAAIKKNAARVLSRDPLELERIEPTPVDLHPYEADFLAAFEEPRGAARRKALQETMVKLVKSVSQKIKGFSRRETVAYYGDIMQRAWAQVEAADTPEVQSEKYDEVMEWTMLDRDYERRTRDVFRRGPVFVPVWWPRYDPSYGRPAPSTPGTPTTAPVSTSPATGRGGPSLPQLPGGDFAASVVNGVQSFSAGVIGNLTDFTNTVTQRTNPPPPPPARSTVSRGGGRGGGGTSCACACACACAGCACACAGGGR